MGAGGRARPAGPASGTRAPSTFSRWRTARGGAAGSRGQRGGGGRGRRPDSARGAPRPPRALVEVDEERGFCTVPGLRRYQPDQLQREMLATPGNWAKLSARGVQIGLELGTYFAGLFADQVAGRGDRNVAARAAQLRDVLTRLGPSFIKAGQILANRPDIVRADYMEELCVLQDDVPAFPDAEAFGIMRETLGRDPTEVFSRISPGPIAAASLGQVYRATLRESGEEVAIKVQRPGVEPNIYRDLVLFRWLGGFLNNYTIRNLGCNAQLIVDEFGEKLCEELDYLQEAQNIEDFGKNFDGDRFVKIPWVKKAYSGPRMLTMEWIDGIRCTDVEAIRREVDVDEFIRVGVVSGLRQLLEFGLFHGDPHPGNLFALPDGRIAYVDFGNVAQISSTNKQVLIDAVIHAVNEDYVEMAGDFGRLGFLGPDTDIKPIVPALETIWKDSMGQSLKVFNFRTVTKKFNELVFQYPIRIPERYSLVIRSLLTQEGICMTLSPNFYFLEVAYPYVAKRLLTDEDPALRDRLIQVLFKDGKFQWERLENLITLAKEGSGGLDLSDTVLDGAQVVLTDRKLRTQLIDALTEGNQLRLDEALKVVRLLEGDVDPQKVVNDALRDFPSISRKVMLSWADQVLAA